ncbi:MAG: helix-turn-helix domain-containing protein [Azonexus sp.]|jgi:transcriptional regulator with XRE-family HTH domain|uniref:helix-turn-helix domain-containing protein n=1 Tax=Azonexus sp. TaxID=1872668 RepID=UPI0028366BB6|nr:helix-turn-helix transcriptional regulator [Azonexus sp.]MDR0776933.1 helix-turn-helix domain-containing protein [Azonexus sp.]
MSSLHHSSAGIVLKKRLKEARLRTGLSQEQLGVEAGLDLMSASARMNRYETGARVPNFALVEALAKVLNVPTPYLYAADDSMARMIVAFGMLSEDEKMAALEFVERAARISIPSDAP